MSILTLLIQPAILKTLNIGPPSYVPLPQEENEEEEEEEEDEERLRPTVAKGYSVSFTTLR